MSARTASLLFDRLELTRGQLVLKQGGLSLAEFEGRLEGGDDLAALRLNPLDTLAVLSVLGLATAEAEGLTLVQTPPRRPWLAPLLSEESLESVLPSSARPARLALAAGLLQIHDFWADSHHAAQEADDLGETAVSAFWHGIAHRREPDFINAAYWFRRVGDHPIFGLLGEAARRIVDGSALAARIAPDGRWDPFAFLEDCRAGRESGLLRSLQRQELALLLNATVEGVLRSESLGQRAGALGT